MATVTDTPELERLFAAGRARAQERADGRERAVEGGMAVSFLVAAARDGAPDPLAALARPGRPSFLIVAYVIACRAQFEIADGYTVPTELILVPMLFLLPTPVVPLVVSVSWVLGGCSTTPPAAPASTAPSTSSATAGTRSGRRWS